MPGGGVKFTIRHDKITSRDLVDRQQTDKPRSVPQQSGAGIFGRPEALAVVESPLLYHADGDQHAWQYIDWQFDGDYIVFVSRTAYDDGLGGAS